MSLEGLRTSLALLIGLGRLGRVLCLGLSYCFLTLMKMFIDSAGFECGQM